MLAGMLWLQGESDALDTNTAKEYQSNLTHLIADIRTEFGVPQMPFIISKIMQDSTWGHYDIVRAAQQAVADADPWTDIFDFQGQHIILGHYNFTDCGAVGHLFASTLAPFLNTPALAAANFWNFTTGLQGWNTLHSLTSSLVDSALALIITGADPYFHSPNNLALAASTYPYVIVRMKNNTSDTQANLFWITNKSSGYDGVKTVAFNVVPNDTRDRDYIVDLTQVSAWQDTITQIRIDPVNSVTSGSVNMSFVKFASPYGGTLRAIPGIRIRRF